MSGQLWKVPPNRCWAFFLGIMAGFSIRGVSGKVGGGNRIWANSQPKSGRHLSVPVSLLSFCPPVHHSFSIFHQSGGDLGFTAERFSGDSTDGLFGGRLDDSGQLGGIADVG